MFADVKGKQLCAKPIFFIHFIVTLTFGLQNQYGISLTSGGGDVLSMMFYECMCKRKVIMRKNILSNRCIVTLTFDLLTPKSIGHILNSLGAFV